MTSEGAELPVIRRAHEDIAAGRLWKARDRLTGALRSYPADQGILALLGRVYYEMRDLPEAAKYWYLTEVEGPELTEAVEALHGRYGPGNDGLARALPVRADPSAYPPVVAGRLNEILEDVKWVRRVWAGDGRGTAGFSQKTLFERVKERLLLSVLVLATVGVWIVGVLALLRVVFGE